ncbi:membrane protein DedA, SNARE-associated domain [Dehalogenimonas formicexedens]|uniref:Membrane protein DedA, SNARE-associated domain n=1 Tax=Dehalogenimonas formicexedens TaxID=1839801 RepID=A0A1P8F4U0_9CHLR|nr:VTT domain-containing protein [Dehalogenimonas formicexedens]APV43496.1 membrane protein DedA, SNARE-associated domain [Dehalogenimonas formicexedens]
MVQNLFDSLSGAILSVSPFAIGGLILLGIIMEVGIPDFAVCDLTLIFIGFTFGLAAWQVVIFFGAIFAGRAMGYTGIFLLSKKYGDRFSDWLCAHSPKLENKLIDLETRLNKHSTTSILFTRLGPGLLTAASIASGLSNIKYRQFVLGSAFSALVADGTRIAAGSVAPHGAVFLGIKVQTWEIVLAVTVGVAFFWFMMARLQAWYEKKHPSKVNDSFSSYQPRTCPLPPEKPRKNKKGAMEEIG